MFTIEEYARLPDDRGYRSELVEGRLVREPQPGGMHGFVASRVYDLLRDHAATHGGHAIFHAGFLLRESPPTVRGPDVAWLAAGRLPVPPPPGFISGAPDLAVEVVSPGNTMTELQRKVFDYLDTGAGCVWIVDPINRSLTAWDAAGRSRVHRGDAVITGTGALSGLTFDLARLFD
jgi:Uma2 family endonuclease